ncbi:hypothetical protein V6N13_132399 [Hibiscus sabdariffa]|uniref:Uncharacterized protein n=1 Tax=Hibiscus sabdariffa TaxID=183260 RepID=A0ABR2PV73_9ROSI
MVTRSQKLVLAQKLLDRKGENMKCDQNNSPSSYGLSCIGTEAAPKGENMKFTIFETPNMKQEVEEIKENNSSTMPRPDETPGLFRQFDTERICTNQGRLLCLMRSLVSMKLPVYALYTLQATQGKISHSKHFPAPFDEFVSITKSCLQHFEALVKEHFSKHAETIILACNAYMEGAPVGSALECSANGRDEHV